MVGLLPLLALGVLAAVAVAIWAGLRIARATRSRLSPGLVEIGAIDTNNARGVAVSGDFVLVADINEGLLVIDASIPTAPRLVGAYRPGMTVSAVAVTGHHGFVNVEGITVLDVGNPAEPVVVQRYATEDWPDALVVGGTTLLATLAASASYIAAPTAMRIAVPEANPALSIGVALGITFPFNIFVGVPLYLQYARWIGGS